MRGLEAGLDLSRVDLQSSMEDTGVQLLGPIASSIQPQGRRRTSGLADQRISGGSDNPTIIRQMRYMMSVM